MKKMRGYAPGGDRSLPFAHPQDTLYKESLHRGTPSRGGYIVVLVWAGMTAGAVYAGTCFVWNLGRTFSEKNFPISSECIMAV